MGSLASACAEPSRRLETPDFSHDVDAKSYLDACPPGATTRGTFFQHVRDHVRAALGRDKDALYEGVSRRSWHSFHLYPLVEFMHLALNAGALLHPHLPSSEALRRIGLLSFSSFAATMSGRVVLFALGERLEDVVEACPTAYRLTLPASVVRVTRLSSRHYRIEMRNVHSFVDTYHCGVIEGAITALAHQPTMKVQRHSRLCDADFDVAW
jgi:uncharacterized protein (TIGR02265 family)